MAQKHKEIIALISLISAVVGITCPILAFLGVNNLDDIGLNIVQVGAIFALYVVSCIIIPVFATYISISVFRMGDGEAIFIALLELLLYVALNIIFSLENVAREWLATSFAIGIIYCSSLIVIPATIITVVRIARSYFSRS